MRSDIMYWLWATLIPAIERIGNITFLFINSTFSDFLAFLPDDLEDIVRAALSSFDSNFLDMPVFGFMFISGLMLFFMITLLGWVLRFVNLILD